MQPPTETCQVYWTQHSQTFKYAWNGLILGLFIALAYAAFGATGIENTLKLRIVIGGALIGLLIGFVLGWNKRALARQVDCKNGKTVQQHQQLPPSVP